MMTGTHMQWDNECEQMIRISIFQTSSVHHTEGTVLIKLRLLPKYESTITVRCASISEKQEKDSRIVIVRSDKQCLLLETNTEYMYICFINIEYMDVDINVEMKI